MPADGHDIGSDDAPPVTYADAHVRPAKRLPAWWLRILILIPLLGILWIRSGDRLGDLGMTNFLTVFLAAASATLAVGWFVIFSGYSKRQRLGLPLILLVLGGAFRLFVKIENFSGTLVPRLSLRFGSGGSAAPPQASPGRQADLTSTSPLDFPGFLGANRDGAVDVQLAEDWAARPPKQLWRQPIGLGWAGFAVVNGVAVTLEQRGGADNAAQYVTAYDLRSGEMLWNHSWSGAFSHPMGGVGPRSTPLIDNGRVYVVGVSGELKCLDGSTGQIVWERNLLKDYGVSAEHERRVIAYGRSNSPLIHGDMLLVPAGGMASGKLSNLTAYNKYDGSVLWEGSKRQISFSSPRFAVVAGVPQFLIVNEETLSGHAPEDGRRLWEYPWPGRTSANANVSQAVPISTNRVFVSKGYGRGAAVLELSVREDGVVDVRPIWNDSRVLRTKFTNIVQYQGHAYGLSDGILECVDLGNGQKRWKAGRYGHGQILRAGGLLLVLSEEGEVALVKLTSDIPNQELGRFQALEGQTWNNMALYGDLLAVRNGQQAAVYQLPLAADQP